LPDPAQQIPQVLEPDHRQTVLVFLAFLVHDEARNFVFRRCPYRLRKPPGNRFR
jgi:hypothetical protein